MTDFAARVEAFLAGYFELHPLRATDVGMHAYDDRWPDLTEDGRLARLAFYRRWSEELAGTEDASLDADERIDRDLLLLVLDEHHFTEARLREERWDAVSWALLLGDGIFPLLVREFAPLGDRLASIAARLESVPAVVDAAIESLTGIDGRPVSRLHAETALEQLPGVGELADEAVREADAHADDPRVAVVAPRLHAAAEVARTAVARLDVHLREVVVPASEGEGRLGPELFAEKLRHTLADPRLTPERVLAAARHDYAVVRAEMVRLARVLWPTWCPAEPLPTADREGSDGAAEQRVVRGVLDAIASDHQPPDALLDFCRAEVGRIADFCGAMDMFALPEEPLEIRWTPVFLRSFGGAMLIPPGPLDRGLKSFFAITPTPDEWTSEQVESYLREDNDRMLRVLAIHEAVPGHYLQLAASNRSASLVRAIFWSGVFAEGWAVYVTQVMMDLGYGADDPALMLVHWKFYLRAAINAIIDAEIQAGGMGEDEAVRLMVEGGFQELSEARNKYKRARLTSTQLSTYFVGSAAFWAVELEARRRAATVASGPAVAEAIEAGPLPGGFGETPGFVYRDHLEAVLGHGTPPLPLLERILFG